jgi:hypothetical protein
MTTSRPARAASRSAIVATALLLLLHPASSLANHHEANESAPAAKEAKPAPKASKPASAASTKAMKKWDAKEVNRLAELLRSRITKVRKAFKKEPEISKPVGTKKKVKANEFDTILKSIQISSRQLANKVQSGKVANETRDIARKIGSSLSEAHKLGGRIAKDDWAANELKLAKKTLSELAPYFGSEPLYGAKVDKSSARRKDTGKDETKKTP